MKQYWNKLGLIFCPSGEDYWLQTHAAVPIAEHLSDDYFRIYFSSRDVNNKSYTGYVVIDINYPNIILNISQFPILANGNIGEFDDSGAMATWLTSHRGIKYLYYIGWNLGVTVPFRNSIGLALSYDDQDFSRYSNGPIIDRSKTEPHFCASCCVIPGNEVWRMWYLSCTEWFIENNLPKHKYHIKYAESVDGINWTREGVVAIDYANEKEYAISRPSVIYEGGIWKMWFSYRSESYRIGYAESVNAIDWKRMDHLVGMDVSLEGWDSEMIEYPFVFDHKGKRYMLYNGNGYGKTGFGLAILQN